MDEKLKVELDFLAVRFAKYYWDMYYKFRLRQSHTPSDVNIHQFFKDKNEDPRKPPKLEDLASDKYREMRKNIIAKSIRPEVLRKLNNDLNRYEVINGKNYILFDYSIVNFLDKYRGILIPAINYVLTRYLERINIAPRIAEKVGGIPSRDNLTNSEKDRILEFQKKSCFYCSATLAGKYHFDHIIPFDYIFQTEIFNCVPACETCNLKKSNKLPTNAIFNKVLERNQSLAMPKDYSQEWYQNLYEKCLVEYHGSQEFFQANPSN